MIVDFRYRRLGYVALNVSDMTKSENFYTSLLGLQSAGEALNGERLYRCSRRHHDIILHQGAAPGLRRVGWQMEDAENTAKIRRHLEGLGISTVDVSADEQAALGIATAFRITEPNSGATIE